MSLLLSLALFTEGQASYYAPGLMDEVYANRLGWGHVQPCESCVGMVALLDVGNLGRLVYLDFGDDLGIEGPFLVVDVAQAEHRAGLRKRNRVVEVDYATARRHHMNGPIPVRVLWRPPEVCRPVRGAC